MVQVIQEGWQFGLKKNVEFKLIDEYKDDEGRLLLINVEINNAIYTIINIYAPNNMNKKTLFSNK